jgi:hypothetical protein
MAMGITSRYDRPKNTVVVVHARRVNDGIALAGSEKLTVSALMAW